jgi:D-amino peptidase
MRILISADIEGVAGVVAAEQTRSGNNEYERARRWLTQEVNAAIRGACAGGADDVVISDAHGNYRNLLADELDPRARCVSGKPRRLGMLEGLDASCAGVMFVGYHARAQAAGVLAHTINSSAFARVWLDGHELGEAGIYAALAGEMGVPVILASGDDAFADETQPLLADCRFVVTKEARGRHSALSLAPLAACAAIESAARQAVENATQARAWRLPLPLCVRVQTVTPAHADLFCLWPTLERIDACTLEFAADSVEHAVRVLNALSAMACMLR